MVWNLWCGGGALTQSPCWRRETFAVKELIWWFNKDGLHGLEALIFIFRSFLSSTLWGQILRTHLLWSHRQNLRSSKSQEVQPCGFPSRFTYKRRTTRHGWLDFEGVVCASCTHTQQCIMDVKNIQKLLFNKEIIPFKFWQPLGDYPCYISVFSFSSDQAGAFRSYLAVSVPSALVVWSEWWAFEARRW